MMENQPLQNAKSVVKSYQRQFDNAPDEGLASTLERLASNNYRWRGVHPFYEQVGAQAVCEVFWSPLRTSFSSLQRREDIFFAGLNDVDDGQSLWVCSMGHWMALFDRDWLGISATGRMIMLPYVEFHRVEGEEICESAFFCDIISVMQQSGVDPLPPQTGAAFIRPGPIGHDGQLLNVMPTEAGVETMALLNRMIDDLNGLNLSGNDNCSPDLLAKSWAEDMAWYGPAGIGSTMTIPRYQKQHQNPFRQGLIDKVYNGHVARFAEGNYAGFFGWANLSNRLSGGFLGMPAGEVLGEMRIVDIYRRDGDKLVENWVLIDLLHYFSQQGLDILERMRSLK